MNNFATGIWLGLGAAVPIGPVNVEVARRALLGGFIAGFALGCGAVTVDVTYAVLSSLSVAPLVNHPAVKWPLGIGGLLLLSYLGVQCLRAAVRHWRGDALAAAAAPVGSARGGYLTGLLMTFLNPMTLVFWFVSVPAAGAVAKDRGHDLPMMCVGVFIGTIAWVIFFSGLLSWAGQWRRAWWMAAADAIGGIMLLALGLGLLWRLFHQPV